MKTIWTVQAPDLTAPAGGLEAPASSNLGFRIASNTPVIVKDLPNWLLALVLGLVSLQSWILVEIVGLKVRVEGLAARIKNEKKKQ